MIQIIPNWNRDHYGPEVHLGEYQEALTPVTDNDLELLLTIRMFEQRLLQLFTQNKLRGTTHTCMGQEYVPVAVSALLDAHDHVFSNHRGHGHYLARYRDAYGLLCEITGKRDGICGGVGGSQHIFRENYLSTGVQGESVPVACGVALSFKVRGTRGLALAYIGDGTWGEGAVYEGLNMAALWGVPLVIVVENNRIAQTTPIALNMAGTIKARAEAFRADFVRVVDCDINRIREALAPRFDAVRRTNVPLVVEFDTVRLGPHSKETIRVARRSSAKTRIATGTRAIELHTLSSSRGWSSWYRTPWTVCLPARRNARCPTGNQNDSRARRRKSQSLAAQRSRKRPHGLSARRGHPRPVRRRLQVYARTRHEFSRSSAHDTHLRIGLGGSGWWSRPCRMQGHR